VPDGLPAQAALYRSLLAGRRVLVVLDNAREIGQVRPLLPGAPGCLALVTSRDHLGGLVAVEGAYPLTLDLLPADDARELLEHRLGAARVTSEPAAVDAIIAGCARLPLALTIAAARAAARPTFPLSAVASELREAASALDPFDAGDITADVRAVLSCSYLALSAGAARLFRLLGLQPGPDTGLAAAASLAAIPPQQARRLLAELTRAHLLTEHAPGRYAFHDLLRAYAAEQAHSHDSQPDRDAALHRLLDHYLHTAHQTAAPMEHNFDPATLPPPQPGVVIGEPATGEDAQAWFTTEYATLVAAVPFAAEAGFRRHSWQLAWAVIVFLLRRGFWDDLTRVCQAGLDAARSAGDTLGQAHALHGLALGYARSGRFAEAYPLFQRALAEFGKAGDHASQAVIHSSLAWLSEREQRPADMLSHSLTALDLYRAAGHQAGQAMILNDVGYSHAMLGNFQEALTCCQQALGETRKLGHLGWEDAIWDSLGYIHHQLGDLPQAVACYERSIGICRDRGDRYNEATTLDHLGDVHRTAGDVPAARRAWARGLYILDELSHPDADQLRAKLCSCQVRPARSGDGPPGQDGGGEATGQVTAGSLSH
jgi:tetratricopeptide (TPR) repeat protein